MKTLSNFCSRQAPGNSEPSLRFDKNLILRFLPQRAQRAQRLSALPLRPLGPLR